jgi:quercetin dioxygenase-like cupin family protein
LAVAGAGHERRLDGAHQGAEAAAWPSPERGMTHGEALDPDRLARDALHFRRRVVELAPGEVLPLEPAGWQDAVVFLTSGEIELECVRGERRRFGPGAVLCFAPPVSTVRNCSTEPARLIAISRRRPEPPARSG